MSRIRLPRSTEPSQAPARGAGGDDVARPSPADGAVRGGSALAMDADSSTVDSDNVSVFILDLPPGRIPATDDASLVGAPIARPTIAATGRCRRATRRTIDRYGRR